jgi:SH3 domain protein
VLAVASAVAAGAETLYVTDRIEVGLHQQPSRDSAIASMISSGTELEVLERAGELARVRSRGGDEGWLDARYLTAEPPAARALAAARDGAGRVEARLAEALEQVRALLAAAEAARAAQAQAEAERETIDRERSVLAAEVESLRAAPAESAALSQALHDVQRLAEDNRTLKQDLAELEANRAMVLETSTERQAEPPPPPESAPQPTAQSTPAHSAPNLLGFLTWQPWQWLLLISGLLLAFGAGGYLVDFSVRRRHGGFRI